MLFHKSTSLYHPVISNSNPKNPTDIHVQVVGGEIPTLGVWDVMHVVGVDSAFL